MSAPAPGGSSEIDRVSVSGSVLEGLQVVQDVLGELLLLAVVLHLVNPGFFRGGDSSVDGVPRDLLGGAVVAVLVVL